MLTLLEFFLGLAEEHLKHDCFPTSKQEVEEERKKREASLKLTSALQLSAQGFESTSNS